MKPGYEPKTLAGKLHWLSEEAAEVLQACSKTARMAEERGISILDSLHSYNPDVPVDERETNHAWIRREMADLKEAILLFEMAPIPCVSGVDICGYDPGDVFTCLRCKKLRCYCAGSDAEECVPCSVKRKNARDEKNPKPQAHSSRPKRKRAASGIQSKKRSARAR